MPTADSYWDDLTDDRPHRFDDRARTVLAGLGGDRPARRTAWRQAIDLLSQPGRNQYADGALVAAVEAVGADIDPATRAEAARAAAFGAPPLALVLLFGNDRPTIAVELLRSVTLSPDGWAEVLPQLSPVARGILRARRDLDADTRARLQGFGRIDFALPAAMAGADGEADVADGEPGMTRIADLVARIEAYRQNRPPRESVVETAAVVSEPAIERAPPLADFAFETDADGTVDWVDAVDRAPLIGLSIGRLADPGGSGVDGAAYGAVRRRCAFRDARLFVNGSGSAAGDWRISATPAFDATSGRCIGYRGVAARPRADQQAQRPDTSLHMAPDSLRQMVHELRTPLNAIGGFAELIAGQVMGPVAAPYRAAAGRIGVEADRVIAAIDDLDLAARIDGERLDEEPGVAGFVHAVRVALSAQEPELAARGAGLILAGGDITGAVAGDAGLVERLTHRFVATFAPFAGERETLTAQLDENAATVDLALDRPRALAGIDGAAMLDGGAGTDPVDNAPLLGLGFAVRLIAGLARSLGGAIDLDGERLTLSLPAAATARVEEHGG